MISDFISNNLETLIQLQRNAAMTDMPNIYAMSLNRQKTTTKGSFYQRVQILMPENYENNGNGASLRDQLLLMPYMLDAIYGSFPVIG